MNGAVLIDSGVLLLLTSRLNKLYDLFRHVFLAMLDFATKNALAGDRALFEELEHRLFLYLRSLNMLLQKRPDSRVLEEVRS